MFLLLPVHYTHQYTLLFWWHLYHVQNIRTYQHCCYCWLHSYYRDSNSFLRGLSNIAQANTTADILMEDQLRPPLDMVTVNQERERENCTNHIYSWNKCESNRSWVTKIFFPSSSSSLKRKRSSCRCLLEHLESFSTKIKTRGPIVRQLCVGVKRRNQLHMNFTCF